MQSSSGSCLLVDSFVLLLQCVGVCVWSWFQGLALSFPSSLLVLLLCGGVIGVFILVVS